MEREAKLPVTVLTGFLGAGKTTLLQTIMRAGEYGRIGVIMNELGQAGIEKPLGGDGDYFELTGGCVCCLVNRDLETTLKELCARFELDRVVLETTGLAQPRAIVWNLQPQVFDDKLRLDAVVCVVDPTAFAATQSAEWTDQVQQADLIVLSKSDLATPAQLQEATDAVRALNANARVLDAQHPDTLDVVMGEVQRRPRQLQLFAPKVRHSEFETVSFETHAPLGLDALKRWLAELPAGVVRAKGFVPVDTGLWCRFHVVAGRVDVGFEMSGPAHRLGRVVVFGRAIAGLKQPDAAERAT